MDETTVQFYEKNAAEIALRYETVGSPVERYFGAAFVAGSRILDIGSGSGRDAERLVKPKNRVSDLICSELHIGDT